VKLAGRVSGLIKTLAAYRDYYRRLHGEAIEPWPLVVQMLETFVEADRDFRHGDGDRAKYRSEGAAGARTGAGKESRNS
jgi:hypothetical protein